jgi:uncharacterized membrane protein (DUF2068 family)
MIQNPTPADSGVPPQAHPVAQRTTMRAIALFEAAKGVTALAASLGMLSLLHHDLHHVAVALISHFGLSPGDRYPAMIVQYADVLADSNRRSLVLLAMGYVTLRLVEAYGLWFNRPWGQWLAALSGALYVPFEVRHLVHAPSAISAAVLLGNLAVVAYMVYELWRDRRRGVAPVPSSAT